MPPAYVPGGFDRQAPNGVVIASTSPDSQEACKRNVFLYNGALCEALAVMADGPMVLRTRLRAILQNVLVKWVMPLFVQIQESWFLRRERSDRSNLNWPTRWNGFLC